MALKLASSSNDKEVIELGYKLVKVILAGAFTEAPGAALCGFVAMAKTMLAQAEFLKLIDLEISEGLSADAKGTCDTVGKFVKTLPP